MRMICFFFFFHAEDGIRDLYVTGVQTCALPICRRRAARTAAPARALVARGRGPSSSQIGRASCRERVEISVVAVSLKKKQQGSILGSTRAAGQVGVAGELRMRNEYD